MSSSTIPRIQTAALVHKQSGPLTFDTSYPVPSPGPNELLVRILYTGVCQSDLHTKDGTATGPDGQPITAIKLPHVGGHEGVGRVIAFGPQSSNTAEGGKTKTFTPTSPPLEIGSLVGVRFLSRVCHACEFCSTDREQHCAKSRNHLHHEDGSFQEYCVLDRDYLTVLPKDVDPVVIGPVLCAGVTAYKAVKNADLKKGEWLVVIGAGGGLGHLAVQYGTAVGARVIGVDTGKKKGAFIESLGARFVDFEATKDVVEQVRETTGGEAAHAVVVTSGHPNAFVTAAQMLRINGRLCLVGIPKGDVYLKVPVATIVIKGLRVEGNLVGSMKETMEAVELVRTGKVKVQVEVRQFEELGEVYERLEKGDILGRVVLKVAKE